MSPTPTPSTSMEVDLEAACARPSLPDHDYVCPPANPSEQLVAALAEIQRLQGELENSKKDTLIEKLSKSDSQVRFYTGFPDYRTLMDFFQCIEPTASKMTTYTQYTRQNQDKLAEKTKQGFPHPSLPLINQLILVLKKLRLGSLDQELSNEFNISTSTVGRIFKTWINYLYVVLGSLPLWPSKQQIKDHLPQVFNPYPNTRVILDCTEIWVQTPSSLYLNSEFYSHYKGHTTLKGLVGITPSGAVSFVSALHPGSISDKAITRVSGILDLIEPGDQVMVDKGFVIEDLLAEKGASLVIPPFLTAARGQLSKSEVKETQNIARLRVHVERAIRRIKCFHIFDGVVPLSSFTSINQIWTVCCLLTNFNGDLF